MTVREVRRAVAVLEGHHLALAVARLGERHGIDHAFTFSSFYTPVSTGAFTASLADGATLDLTEWNGACPIASVTAPAGATVTVKVDMDDEKFRMLALSKDAETGKHNGKLLSFGGARPADTTFVPDAVSANRCRFIADENGDLILAFLPGTALIIK